MIERETGLEQIAETGVMIHGDLSADLLRTIFSPKSPLHDGAVIVRGGRILAAGALLPLGETTIHSERFGTRHRAALGTTEQTDAIVIVVSEENGQISLVQRARIVRNLNEAQLARALRSLLEPAQDRARIRLPAGVPGARSPRLADLGRAVRTGRRDRGAVEPLPPDEPLVPDEGVAPDDSAPNPGITIPAAAEAGAGAHERAHEAGPQGARLSRDPRTERMTRALRFILHNWPLKLAAVALATLLYGGLVLSQTTQPFTDPVPIRIPNPPAGVIVLSNLGSVTRISYVAPPDLGLRIDRSTFEASVDLSGVQPTGEAVPVRVTVEAVDDRDPGPRLRAPGDLGHGRPPGQPGGADRGRPAARSRRGSTPAIRSSRSRPPSSAGRNRWWRPSCEVEAEVSIDATGVDVNVLVPLIPVDVNGDRLGAAERIEVEPALVRVRVPVFTDRRTKSLPVTPVVSGTPAAGFLVASVTVTPSVVNVEGDANDLAGLEHLDTAPVVVAGASSELVQEVGLVLPVGVQAFGDGTVRVTVRLRPVTATRTFEAGLVLVGERARSGYELSTDRVLVTISGSVAELDRLRRDEPDADRRRHRPRPGHPGGRGLGKSHDRADAPRREPQSGRGNRLHPGGICRSPRARRRRPSRTATVREGNDQLCHACSGRTGSAGSPTSTPRIPSVPNRRGTVGRSPRVRWRWARAPATGPGAPAMPPGGDGYLDRIGARVQECRPGREIRRDGDRLRARVEPGHVDVQLTIVAPSRSSSATDPPIVTRTWSADSS